MTVGYTPGNEPMWWWNVAKHLDEAQKALANAMAHNLDDQKATFLLQDTLNGAQAVLLEIFRAKGLVPSVPAAPVVQEAVLVPPVPFTPPAVIVGTVTLPANVPVTEIVTPAPVEAVAEPVAEAPAVPVPVETSVTAPSTDA